MASNSLEVSVDGSNLYVTGRIIRFDSGEELLVREKLFTIGTLQDKYHTVKVGDELTRLAWRYYGRTVVNAAKYWWVIADANNITDPIMELETLVGTDILIPNILNVKVRL